MPTPTPSPAPVPTPSPLSSPLTDALLMPKLDFFSTTPITTTNHPLIDFALSMGFLFGGIALGSLVGRLIRAYVKKSGNSQDQEWGELVARGLANMPGILICMLGAYLALLSWPIEIREETKRIIVQTIFVIAALSVTFATSRLALLLLQRYSANAPGILPTTSIFGNFIKLVVVLLGILIILQSLGISITPILTALGVGGLAVALALQDTLSNLFSGFQILASRQFAPGDYVRLSSGEEGNVSDIAWRNTTIRSLQQFDIVVPNSTLSKAILTNFGQADAIYNFQIPFSIAYGTDLARAEEVIREVGRETLSVVPGGDKDYEPVVRYQNFADMGLQGQVTLGVMSYTDQFAVRHEFIKRLDARLRADDILLGRNPGALLAPEATPDAVKKESGNATGEGD